MSKTPADDPQTTHPVPLPLPYTVDDLQAYIDRHHIQARLHRNLGHTPTVPAAAQTLGAHPDQIVKTLLFAVDSPATPDPNAPTLVGPAVVVISHGERRIDLRALAEYLHISRKRVKLAPPAVVLDLLGFPAGGVPPFGHRNALPTLLDESIITLDHRIPEATQHIFAGGGDDRTMLELSIAELCRVTRPTILSLSAA